MKNDMLDLLDRGTAVRQARVLQRVVRDWRDTIEAEFPEFATPDKRNAARFVDTEGAEVTDAFLRLGDWSRNSERGMDVDDEVGDLLFMLVTAMDPAGKEGADMVGAEPVRANPSVDELVGYSNNVFNWVVLGWWVPSAWPIQLAIYAVLQYCYVNEVDPVRLVEKRLARILDKRRGRARKRDENIIHGRDILKWGLE